MPAEQQKGEAVRSIWRLGRQIEEEGQGSGSVVRSIIQVTEYI